MKAILLAAGYGRRMRPLTDHEHKALLKIDNRTILSRIIDGLLQNGINEIIVAIGYLGNRIQAYLDEYYPEIDFIFVENQDFSNTNNIHTLAIVFNRLDIDDDIILIETDLIYQPSVINRIITSPKENVALVDRYRQGMDGTVVTISNQIITSIIPPHLQSPDFDFSDKYKTLNIYKFSRAFCTQALKKLLSYYASIIDQNSYYELILGILIYVQKVTMYAEIIDREQWAELDDPNDLAEASFIFNPQERLKILQQNCGGYWNYQILDFSYIRNMYFPTAAILSEIKSNLENLIFNYGSTQQLLNEKLSYFLLCRVENVILLNGCSQIYPLLASYYKSARVSIPHPTFGEYSRIFPAAARYSDAITINLLELERQTIDADLIVIVNPNNPTGSYLDTESILELARRYPAKDFIIDESFIDFAPTTSAMRALELERQENLIIIKSLSKTLGVPGLRLGFSYSCNVKFNTFIRSQLPIWNSNSIAEYFLEVVLKHRETLCWSFQQTIRDRTEFAAALRELDCVAEVYHSAGNFLLVRFIGQLSQWQHLPEQLIAEHSIYLKDVSAKLADGNFYLRVAVRLPAENQRLLDCLKLITQQTC